MAMRATGARLAAFMILAPVASEAQVLKREPGPGGLRCGQSVLVDDGKCPRGQIRQVIGACNIDTDGRRRGRAERTRRCVPRR